MRRFIKLIFVSLFWIISATQTVLAGPFGIDMGMKFDDVKKVCHSIKHIEDDLYEIVPPQMNAIFERYIVKIDHHFGVYWLKGIGKDIFTNGYGNDLKATFLRLVESIEKTYGEASYIEDGIKEGSYWAEAKYFMNSLKLGDRELYAIWSKEMKENDILSKLLDNSPFKEKMYLTIGKRYPTFEECVSYMRNTPEWESLYNEKMSEYGIEMIGVFASAIDSTSGYVTLEYSFSNYEDIQEQADSVF